MKIGVLTDIHNNVVALNAVLKEFDKENCEKIVCAGDIIGIGPYPEETVQRMMSIPNLIAVRGNHEKYLLEGLPSQYPNDEGMGYEEMEYHKWERGCLSKQSILFLSQLPYRINFHECSKRISVMHYCMNQDNRYINYTPNPSKSDLKKLFPDAETDIVIYGHDHTRTLCHSANKWFINSGSLGCPGIEQNIARALILEITESGRIFVRNINVKYDVYRVIKDIDHLNYPASKEIKHFFFGLNESML